MKVYLAGGMYSGWQKTVKGAVPHHTYIDPRDHGLAVPELWSAWDLLGVESCDVVFALFEADNPSGWGMLTELSYGAGLGKHVIFASERTDELEVKRLALARHLAHANFTDLNRAIDYLRCLP